MTESGECMSGGGGVAGGASRRFSASLWIGLGLGVGNSGRDVIRLRRIYNF